MNRQNAARRLTKLIAEIEELRYRYHVLNDPAVSDAVYESLSRELKALEAQYPKLRDPNSPTQRVGGKPLAKFTPREHKTPMLSLNDAFSLEELSSWYRRMLKLLGAEPQLHLDIKMDGLAAALIYDNSEFSYGVTRGNGQIGEDVSSNLRTIASIPLKLRPYQADFIYRSRVEIRGEILIYKDDFARINTEREAAGRPLYANPRNLAAGSVRQLDPQLAAARPLRFHAYGVLCDPALPSLQAEYELAAQLGFIVNPEHEVVTSLEKVQERLEAWEKRRHDLPFLADGLVISVNERAQLDRLGVAGKAPRGMIAYKYPAEQATTKVKDIQVNVGRTGAVTPFAVLEPVPIAGSRVGTATLHNSGEIARKDIRIGDSVIVQKAGDIIPEVVASLPKLRDGSEKIFKMPDKCPVCRTRLNKPGEEKVSRCPNPNCPSRIHRQLEHFVSKQAFDIDGLGERLVKLLLDQGLIRDAADLFTLSKEQLLELEGFQDKSAQNLIDAISASKQPPLDRFIFGLGIRHVGRQTAIDLAQSFDSLEKLAAATAEELAEIEGVGAVVAEAIAAWFVDPLNQQLLRKLAKNGIKPQNTRFQGATLETKLKGKTFVITGTLDSLSREEAAYKIRAAGGKITASISKNTDYVVVGENPGSNKLEQMKKFNTKRLTEAQLLKLTG